MSMYDLAAPTTAGASPTDPMQAFRMMQMMHMMQNQNLGGQNAPTTAAGAIGNGLMSAMLMNPDLMKDAKTGLGNLWSGATGSMINQYLQGGAGINQGPMPGGNGMNTGGQ